MKKVLSIILALMLALTACSISSFAESVQVPKSITYSSTGDTISVQYDAKSKTLNYRCNSKDGYDLPMLADYWTISECDPAYRDIVLWEMVNFSNLIGYAFSNAVRSGKVKEIIQKTGTEEEGKEDHITFTTNKNGLPTEVSYVPYSWYQGSKMFQAGHGVEIHYNPDSTIHKFVFLPAHAGKYGCTTETFIYKNGTLVKAQTRYETVSDEGENTDFTYDSQGKLISAQTTLYSGNTQEKLTRTFTYNNQNQISKIVIRGCGQKVGQLTPEKV